MFKLSHDKNFKIYQGINDNTIEIESNYSNHNIATKYSFSNEMNIISINSIEFNMTKDLTDHQNDKLQIVINNYAKIFSKNKYDIGAIRTEFCKIELTNQNPMKTQ